MQLRLILLPRGSGRQRKKTTLSNVLSSFIVFYTLVFWTYFAMIFTLTHNFIYPKDIVRFTPLVEEDGQLETCHDWLSFGMTIVGQPGVGLPPFIL